MVQVVVKRKSLTWNKPVSGIFGTGPISRMPWALLSAKRCVDPILVIVIDFELLLPDSAQGLDGGQLL
jgi:hypothetical protein